MRVLLTMTWRPLLLLTLAATTGCSQYYIPNTDVEDSDENRKIVAFCEVYRRAVERKDIATLLDLASPHYYEDGGNVDATDDIDYAGLRDYLIERFEDANAIRYEIRYRRVSKDEDFIFVDYTYSGSFRLPGEKGDKWRSTVEENRPRAGARRRQFQDRRRHVAAVAAIAASLFSPGLAGCSDRDIDRYPAIETEPIEQACAPGTTRACYDGPEGTEGVGACRGGTQICGPYGRIWGACQDMVLPAREVCGSDADLDCDGITSCGETIWSRRYGVDRDEAVRGIAVDAAGSVSLAGQYRDPIDMGSGDLTAIDGSRDVFIAKLSAEGTTRYVRAFYSEEFHTTPRDVAAYPDGGVIAVAASQGDVQTDGGELMVGFGDADILVVRLDPEGEVMWTHLWGDPASQNVDAVALDDDGNAYVAGYFRGDVDFGNGTRMTTDSGHDGFLVKLAARWKLDLVDDVRWRLRRDHPQRRGPTARATAWCSVTTTGNAQIAGTQYDSRGDRDLLVIKVDPQGAVLWSKSFGDIEEQRGHVVAIDSADNIVLAGRTQGTVSFGGDDIEPGGGAAIFVAKLDPQGEHLWELAPRRKLQSGRLQPGDRQRRSHRAQRLLRRRFRARRRAATDGRHRRAQHRCRQARARRNAALGSGDPGER